MYEGLLVDQSLSLNRRMDEDTDVQVDVSTFEAAQKKEGINRLEPFN